MKKLVIAGLALAGAGIWVGDLSAHGGTYRGPGDTVPPGAGGGGGNGPPTGAPTGPAGGTTGGGTPGPVVPGGTTGGTRGAGTTGLTGASEESLDLSAWTFWWEFNKDPFLNLKAAIANGSGTTGGIDFFLGTGEADQGDVTLLPTQRQIRDEIVPALLGALRTESNPDIVTGCLIALAKIGEATDENGDNAFEQVITGFLDSGSQEISETAALALGILASNRSVDLLEALVRDNSLGQKAVGSTEVDPNSRAFAAYGLGLLGNRTGDPAVRARIVSILTDVLPRAELLARQDLAVACVISIGLTPLDPGGLPAEGEGIDPAASRQQQIDFLLEFMVDQRRNFMSRAHVPAAVARLLDGLDDEACRKRVVDQLLVPVDPRKGSKFAAELRQSCTQALGLIGDADDDPLDREIRKALIAQVPELQGQSRKFGLISMARVAANPGQGAANLAANRAELTNALVAGLRRTSGEDQWAALALGLYGYLLNHRDEAPAAALAQALRERLGASRSGDDIGSTAVAVGLFGDLGARDGLVALLEEVNDPQTQGYVALGLGLLGDKRAIEPIQKVLDDAEYKPQLLQQAATALGLLGSKRTVETLVEMLDSAGSLSSQAAAASALGFIGDRSSVSPLIAMLQDDSLTETARGFAAVALGIVADKEELPWNSKIASDLNYRASTPTLNSMSGRGVLNIL
ncbi:HEAT repeat domain-containing protein [Engelhardtia mirabilis]|uniref:PBS lyase HEAT-like repeat protein n=1 Tax=Engelhardtia mirabilis TaxID=2528011 RepID=A0A518BKQ9_9BACT|nr:PBS lyase HEAT-like repeat protein [Planctomycetes bacterium Pla133]QDV01878.1 PBS lyase HEAT-like repeat protein [Planctomycetes bacterium Pla86]